MPSLIWALKRHPESQSDVGPPGFALGGTAEAAVATWPFEENTLNVRCNHIFTFTNVRSSALIEGHPSSLRVRSVSVRKMSMARATPAGPPAARP